MTESIPEDFPAVLHCLVNNSFANQLCYMDLKNTKYRNVIIVFCKPSNISQYL